MGSSCLCGIRAGIPLERVLPRMVHHVLQAFAGESDTEPAEVAAALKLFMQVCSQQVQAACPL